MDPLTHALSGAACIQALPPAVRPRWLFVWGALVAASPDVDTFFIHNPLEYIVYHRGITHSLVGAALLALVLAGVLLLALAVHRSLRPLPGAKNGWTFPLAAVLAYGLLLHHLWLDCVNSYGTQLFLPFSPYRVRLDGLFIVDPLLVLPLALGLALYHARRGVMLALVLWSLLYPAAAVGVRMGYEAVLAGQLARHDGILTLAPHDKAMTPRSATQETGQPRPDAPGADLATRPGAEGTSPVRPDAHIHPQPRLSPDLFSPLRWKLILDGGDVWLLAGVWTGERLPAHFTPWPKPPTRLWDTAVKADQTFAAYAAFVQYPTLEALIPLPDGGEEATFTDLRFGSTLDWVDALQTTTLNGVKAFRIMARYNADGTLVGVRFVTTRGAGGDSGWHAPVPPRPAESCPLFFLFSRR